MTFINEYVSKENIEKYQLEALWKRTHLGQTPIGDSYSWTFNNERNIFLMLIRSGNEMETANDHTFLLWWDGSEISLQLKREGNANYRTNEGHATWHLKRLNIPPDFQAATVEEVTDVVKQALTHYGFMGAHRTLKNYAVNFSF